MSVQRIIQESIEKNPLGLKEAFAEELTNRIRLALEAKMMEEGDFDDEEDQLDEISKDLARKYIKGAKTDMAIAQKYHRVGSGGPENTKLYQKRKAGVDKAKSRLAK